MLSSLSSFGFDFQAIGIHCQFVAVVEQETTVG
jgi:hypothetical protein